MRSPGLVCGLTAVRGKRSGGHNRDGWQVQAVAGFGGLQAGPFLGGDAAMLTPRLSPPAHFVGASFCTILGCPQASTLGMPTCQSRCLHPRLMLLLWAGALPLGVSPAGDECAPASLHAPPYAAAPAGALGARPRAGGRDAAGGRRRRRPLIRRQAGSVRTLLRASSAAAAPLCLVQRLGSSVGTGRGLRMAEAAGRACHCHCADSMAASPAAPCSWQPDGHCQQEQYRQGEVLPAAAPACIPPMLSQTVTQQLVRQHSVASAPWPSCHAPCAAVPWREGVHVSGRSWPVAALLTRTPSNPVA